MARPPSNYILTDAFKKIIAGWFTPPFEDHLQDGLVSKLIDELDAYILENPENRFIKKNFYLRAGEGKNIRFIRKNEGTDKTNTWKRALGKITPEGLTEINLNLLCLVYLEKDIQTLIQDNQANHYYYPKKGSNTKTNELKKKEYRQDIENNERNIQNFLKIIGKSDSSRYAKIDELYVPPNEYSEILQTLERERIIFISGLPEYGKTFTSVKLLWEWYKKGYEPHWEEALDEEDRIDVRKAFRKIEDNLQPGHVYYFEDPFGKIKYENRGGELELVINQIITSVHNKEDVFVIITSREQVFDEFKKRSLSKYELEKFEKKLHIVSASYTKEMRIKMVEKYASVNSCRWLLIPALKDDVIDEIEKYEHLPTPLSILNFSIYSKNDTTLTELKKHLKTASEDVARQFAKEIMEMNGDEKVFFSLILLGLNWFDLFDNFRDEYNGSPKLADIIMKYRDKYIEVKFETLKEFYLLHPSYYEAKYFLAGEPFFINIVSKIILEYANPSKGRYYFLDKNHQRVNHYLPLIIRIFIENYNHLPSDIKTIFTKISKDTENAYYLADLIIEHYDKLPPEIQNFLHKRILMIEKNSHSLLSSSIDDLIGKYFQIRLPLDVKQIIFEREGDTLGAVIISNWNVLSEENQNLIFKLVNESKAGCATIMAILRNYHSLQKNITELVNKIMQKPYSELRGSDYWLVRTIITENKNFERFPSGVAEFVLSDFLKKNSSLLLDWLHELAWLGTKGDINIKTMKQILQLHFFKKEEGLRAFSKLKREGGLGYNIEFVKEIEKN